MLISTTKRNSTERRKVSQDEEEFVPHSVIPANLDIDLIRVDSSLEVIITPDDY